MIKFCKSCDTEYPATADYFYRDKHKDDGLKARCKECEKHKRTPSTASRKGYRKCTKCRDEYPETTDFFARQKGARKGLTAACKKCRNQAKRGHREDNPNLDKEYYEKNKTVLLAKQKEYHLKNRDERLEAMRAYSKVYYKENIEKIETYREEWSGRNPSYFNKYNQRNEKARKRYYEENKDWLLANQRKRRATKEFRERENKRIYEKYHNDSEYREMMLLHSQKRRTLKAEQEVDFTIDDWDKAKEEFNYKCAYCNSGAKLTMDHIIAISKGGGLTKDNIVPCCGSCNSSKSNKDMEEWFRGQDFFDEVTLQSILRVQKEV